MSNNMPRGNLSKVDILSRIYKMKNSLYNGEYQNKNGEWHDGAHHMLNKVLDAVNEYSQ